MTTDPVDCLASPDADTVTFTITYDEAQFYEILSNTDLSYPGSWQRPNQFDQMVHVLMSFNDGVQLDPPLASLPDNIKFIIWKLKPSDAAPLGKIINAQIDFIDLKVVDRETSTDYMTEKQWSKIVDLSELADRNGNNTYVVAPNGILYLNQTMGEYIVKLKHEHEINHLLQYTVMFSMQVKIPDIKTGEEFYYKIYCKVDPLIKVTNGNS